eukprot:6175458-Pleurochrysis_carterae.AAC.3
MKSSEFGKCESRSSARSASADGGQRGKSEKRLGRLRRELREISTHGCGHRERARSQCVPELAPVVAARCAVPVVPAKSEKNVACACCAGDALARKYRQRSCCPQVPQSCFGRGGEQWKQGKQCEQTR